MRSLECVLVMPAYNEERCISRVVATWATQLQTHFKDHFRILVVDDGSRDQTGVLLDEMARREKRLMVVHQPNGGHGAALLNAYRQAAKLDCEYVFHVDSDDQFRPEDFSLLWELREQSRFLIGFRKQRHDALHRLVITRILRAMLYLIFGAWIRDANVPFRLIRRDYLARLLAELPAKVFAPNIFLCVLAAKDGQNLVGIPVHHEERKTGTVSIVRWKLIKVCLRCARELVEFRRHLGLHLTSLKKGETVPLESKKKRKSS